MSGRTDLLTWVVCAAVLVGSSCTLSTFTQGYRLNYGISDSELERIQFFTSDEIVLERESASQERGTVGNAWSVTSKTKVRQVVIPKGTAAVVLESAHVGNDEYLLVSFSPHDRGKALWFSTERAKTAGRYDLIHVTSLEQGAPVLSKGFALRYDGEDFHLADDAMWQTHLVFDQDFVSHREVDKVSPPGWRLTVAKGK